MILGETKSVCPVCLKVIDAVKCTGPKGIYLEKECEEHGFFSTLIWEGDPNSYVSWDKKNTTAEYPIDAKKAEKGCPYDCGLCTQHKRKGCCMLIELTNRCNLHCPVCFASAGGKEEKDLTLEEIEGQYDFLMSHGGPFNIQLSGGEPTMRDDLPEIIRMGKEKGFSFFQLNTNGLRLAMEEGYAKKLKESGLDTVFLQFDGVTDDVYLALRGRKLFDIKKKAIVNCVEAGLGTVLVPVIAAGINESQVGDIIRFALERMPGVRGVHFQPLSYFGRCEVERTDNPVTIPRMLRLIEEQMEGKMTSLDYTGGGAENPYCSFHASYRRLPDGRIKSLEKRSAASCCCTTSDDSREAVAQQWTRSESEFDEVSMTETSALDEFLRQMKENTFTVSGMVFQDAYNLDLDRVQRCHICEVDSEFGMVPFCAYNLTDVNGKSMYRK